MATVSDISGNGGGPMGSGPENKLDSATRVVAAVIGTTAPNYIGEIVTDSTADVNYRAIGSTNADWVRDNT